METNRTTIPYMSLYDYYGKPMGRCSLSADIFNTARRYAIKIESQQVKTKTYSGEVMLYTKDFLEAYAKFRKVIDNLPDSARRKF